MNFYEKEMRRMFGGSDIISDAKFCGKTMLGRLDDELLVKLQIVSTYIANQYDAVRATIINRRDGEVDNQTFKFSDIIGMQQNSMGNVSPHIWDCDGKPKWYISVTNSAKEQIADTILDYVEMYQQDESIGLSDFNM